MAYMNRQILLKSRPAGMPTPGNFEAVEAPMPAPGDAGVVRRTLFLSLDPYMRGRMSDAPSYAPPVAVGGVMCGHTVSEVVESRDPAFRPGDIVAGYDGWQQYAAGPGKDLRKIDPAAAPVSTAIGVRGMPGFGARIPLCGMISEYNATETQPGPNLRPLLVSRAMIKGFIVSDHYDRFAAFLREVAPLVRDGRIKFREDIVEGLDAAPAAL